MKRQIIILASSLLAATAFAQVGTAASETGKAAVERVEQAGQATAGAVTTGPSSQVHKAKAKSHKDQHQPPEAAAEDPRWAHDLLTETAEQMGGAAFGARVGPHCRYCQVKSSCPLRATEDE